MSETDQEERGGPGCADPRFAGDTLGAAGRLLFAATRGLGRLRADRGTGADAADPGAVRRILVARRVRVGDVVVMLPLLRALRARFPAAEILVGVDRREPAATLLGPDAGADRVVVLDFLAASTPVARARAVLALLRERVDLLVTGEGFSILREAFYCGAPVRVGLDDGHPLQRLATQRVAFDPSRHAAENLLALAEAVGARPAPEDRIPRLPCPPEAVRRAARRTLRAKGLPDDAPFAVLHPGAQKPSRRWPAERFATLAERLLARDAALWILLSGVPDEAELVDAVRGRLPEALRKRTASLVGATNLPALQAVLEDARLLVCNDTGVLHLARARGVPLLALLGPENDAVWGPHPGGVGPAVSLRHAVPCAPCKRWACEPHFCLRALGVDEVEDAAQRLLSAQPAAPDAGALRRVRHDHGWADLARRGASLPLVSRIDLAADGRKGAADPTGGAYSAVERPARGGLEERVRAARGDLLLFAAAGAPDPSWLGEAVAALVRDPRANAVAGPPPLRVSRAREVEAGAATLLRRSALAHRIPRVEASS